MSGLLHCSEFSREIAEDPTEKSQRRQNKNSPAIRINCPQQPDNTIQDSKLPALPRGGITPGQKEFACQRTNWKPLDLRRLPPNAGSVPTQIPPRTSRRAKLTQN